MLVPNSQMLERTVINWTLVDERIRTTVTVGVAYGSPTRRVAELFLQSVSEHPDVLQEPPPRVFFVDYGDSALIFDAYFWTNAGTGGAGVLRLIRSDIRHRLGELFTENGIVIAFPQQDVHLDTARPLQIEIASQPTATTENS
jgi:small-conductance mechanosensitive channel